MPYAIIRTGGKQYRVSVGDRLKIEKLDAEVGQDVALSDVLAVGEGADARIGQPFVAGAKVVGRLEGKVKGEKVFIMKFRRRKNYRRTTGHREKYLQVTINEIVA
jgi:large subunit ribosomal protein L21